MNHVQSIVKSSPSRRRSLNAKPISHFQFPSSPPTKVYCSKITSDSKQAAPAPDASTAVAAPHTPSPCQ